MLHYRFAFVFSALALVGSACAGAGTEADATGTWAGELALTGSTGSPPSSIGGSYTVDATVETKDSGDCGITVAVAEVGTWALADGVKCDNGGFDVTLGAGQNTEITLEDVEEIQLKATSDNKLALVLGGSDPDWTCSFGGDATHSQ